MKVGTAASNQWSKPVLSENLKAIIINFHGEKRPSVDLDNMTKPILDAMQTIVFHDDRQVRQLEISHVRIDSPLVFLGVSMILVSSIQAGNPFVFVRIEAPIEPLPLPRAHSWTSKAN